jgi:hypothetical protein
VKLCFEPGAPLASQAQNIEKGHGRLTKRTCRTSQILHGYSDFPGLHQALEVSRETTYLRTGRTTCELHYAVTSLSPKHATAMELMVLLRQHWAIENKNFHVRDDSWREDRQIRRNGTAAFVLHLLSALALNLLRAPSELWPVNDPLTARAETLAYICAVRPCALFESS